MKETLAVKLLCFILGIIFYAVIDKIIPYLKVWRWKRKDKRRKEYSHSKNW